MIPTQLRLWWGFVRSGVFRRSGTDVQVVADEIADLRDEIRVRW